MNQLLEALENERRTVQKNIAALDAAIVALNGSGRPRRRMSAAAKRKISIAAKRRWAQGRKK